MATTNAISELKNLLESWNYDLEELTFYKEEYIEQFDEVQCSYLTKEQFDEVLNNYATKSLEDSQPHYIIIWLNPDDYTLQIGYYNKTSEVKQLSHEIEEDIDNFLQFPSYPNIYLLIY